MNPLLLLSGSKLAEMIRKREVTSREVVEAHIAHAQKVNLIINAIVKDRFNQAQQEAKKADRKTKRVAPEKLPPFHGVPCTIKESIQLTGMPHTSGLVARKKFRVRKDAPIVARLREAGAIPLGVTNTSELCMWMESYNRVYGRTNNPYNSKCTVGGSSGGEGAIIGAGGSPFGLGSDIGGSIRMPAFFNGIFGHKPTGGLLPHIGQFPPPENEAKRYETAGPLCRRAEDLMPLMKILAGPAGRDRWCIEMPLGDPGRVNLKKLTVYDIEDNGYLDVSDDLREAQRRVARVLKRLGAKVKKIKIEEFKKSFDIWASMLSQATKTSFRKWMGNGKKEVNPFAHLLLWLFRKSPHTLPAIILGAIEVIYDKNPKRIDEFVKKGKRLRDELVTMMGPNGIILYPSHVAPAPRHYKSLFPPFNWVYTAIFNVMEFPVTQVPLGLNKEGLPLGVQVAAIHGNDHVTIAVAMELEKAFGGWVPPPIDKNM